MYIGAVDTGRPWYTCSFCGGSCQAETWYKVEIFGRCPVKQLCCLNELDVSPENIYSIDIHTFVMSPAITMISRFYITFLVKRQEDAHCFCFNWDSTLSRTAELLKNDGCKASFLCGPMPCFANWFHRLAVEFGIIKNRLDGVFGNWFWEVSVCTFFGFMDNCEDEAIINWWFLCISTLFNIYHKI